MTLPTTQDLSAHDLSSTLGRHQLRSDLETLGVPSEVTLWISDLVESHETKLLRAIRPYAARSRSSL